MDNIKIVYVVVMHKVKKHFFGSDAVKELKTFNSHSEAVEFIREEYGKHYIRGVFYDTWLHNGDVDDDYIEIETRAV